MRAPDANTQVCRDSHAARRTDAFPVRRWLAVGAASAGVGAALLGVSLLGPQTGVAAADSSTASSVSSHASVSTGRSAPKTSAPKTSEATRRPKKATNDKSAHTRRNTQGDDGGTAPRAGNDVAPGAAAAVASTSSVTSTASLTPATAQPSSAKALSALVNKAPTVAPTQLTGFIDGPITGTIGASDPEGDALTYRIARAPREGSVALNADGTYTYTPAAKFNGVDTFTVVAADAANTSLFGAPGTRAKVLINQDAITFDFNYTDGSQYWTPDRQAALAQAADNVMLYLVVPRPVTLTYNVSGENDATSGMLAEAGSALISGRSGFWPTVVQHKLQTGIDSNGAAADGQIEWNFAYPWALGDTVGATQYDFDSVALHELLHSLGFLSLVSAAGQNYGTARSVFDRFITTADGTKVFGLGYRWNPSYNTNLTGGAGGLYFGGAHAVAAYGRPVPLYTPNPFRAGSSMSHLDDTTFTGANQQVMNAMRFTGPSVRVLSSVELGILEDLGYQVRSPESPTVATAFVGVLLLGIKRRKTKAKAQSR